MKRERKKCVAVEAVAFYSDRAYAMSFLFLSFLCDKFNTRQLEEFHDPVDFSFSLPRFYYSTCVWFISFMQSHQTTWRLGPHSSCKSCEDDLNARRTVRFLPITYRHELYVYQYSPSVDYFDSCCPINGGSRLKRRKYSTRCVIFLRFMLVSFSQVDGASMIRLSPLSRAQLPPFIDTIASIAAEDCPLVTSWPLSSVERWTDIRLSAAHLIWNNSMNGFNLTGLFVYSFFPSQFINTMCSSDVHKLYQKTPIG